MAYIRKKVINGKEYFYEQACVRDNGKVKTRHIRYVGTSPDSSNSKSETKSITSKENSAKNNLLKPFQKEKWSEKDVNLALRRINSQKITPKEIFDNNKNLNDGEGISLSKEQSEKGFKYLKNLHYTPKGKEKESSPYGYREIDIINNPREIKLVDFYSERGRYYVPLYRAINKDGESMDYYVQNGKISIVG